MEKAKQIYIPDWIENAIQKEARKNHRAWMREALVMLETELRAKGYGETHDKPLAD